MAGRCGNDNDRGRDGVLFMIRRRLTYANVMSTLAVFVALGGSSYAAYTINGNIIKNRSIAGRKLHSNTLTGRQIKESRLGRVPRAHRADLLDGASAEDLKADLQIKCPRDTFPIADVCVERTPRSPQSYGSAVLTCGNVGTPTGPGRRLPAHGELRAALGAVQLAPGGELTSNVYPSSTDPGRLDVLYVTDQVGSVGLAPDTFAGAKAFRCVTDPLN
jgi:hypothetical protein